MRTDLRKRILSAQRIRLEIQKAKIEQKLQALDHSPIYDPNTDDYVLRRVEDNKNLLKLYPGKIGYPDKIVDTEKDIKTVLKTVSNCLPTDLHNGMVKFDVRVYRGDLTQDITDELKDRLTNEGFNVGPKMYGWHDTSPGIENEYWIIGM